jgi:hypothetical protein
VPLQRYVETVESLKIVRDQVLHDFEGKAEVFNGIHDVIEAAYTFSIKGGKSSHITNTVREDFERVGMAHEFDIFIDALRDLECVRQHGADLIDLNAYKHTNRIKDSPKMKTLKKC